jgi:TusA-related sulfurtransferase
VLEVLADDPQAPSDIEAWALRDGHVLLQTTAQARAFRMLVRRGT